MRTIFSDSIPLFVIAVLCTNPCRASETPVVPPPDIQTLTGTKDVPGGNVVLNWSDGSAPFSVQRSESPNFASPTNLIYVTRSTSGGPVNDAVLNDGKTYYYLVTDVSAATEVYSITNTAGSGFYQSETMAIDGAGFDASCANNSVYFDGGAPANLLTCSTTQIQAEIPAHAVSGSVVVVAPNGSSTRQTKLFAMGLRTNTARQAQSHINVDASNNLFIADQTTGFNRIWKLNFTSGASSECANIGNPIGLPRNGSKLYTGTETVSAVNVGTVRELDVSCTPLVTWNVTGTANTDPVYARAMAIDPSGNNPGYVFLLDHAGDRIRRTQNMANLDKVWLTGIGLGGTAAGASDPAGFTFNNAGEFFFTAFPNKIRHFNAAKSLLQELTATDGVSRPSQIVFDEAQTLWVANRDANNVLRIRTDPLNKLVRTKVSGIAAPRGIAFDRDPSTLDPMIYVADQTEVYRFRVYDTIHVDVKVLTPTLTTLAGATTSQVDFEQRVRRDMNRAGDVLKQCGIDVVVDRVLFIADPNAVANGNNGSVLTSNATTLTTEESALLGASRSSNNFAINVYYIHHYTITNPTPPPQTITTVRNGTTYTNDFFVGLPNGQTGVMIARFTAPSNGAALMGGAIDTTAAHEFGHFLLNLYADVVGPGEHHGIGACGAAGAPNSFFLMYGTGCNTRWTIDAPACTNMKTNGDESAYVEQF